MDSPFPARFCVAFLAAWLAPLLLPSTPVTAQEISVVDVAVDSGLQGQWGDKLRRGRALIAADFDLDGRVDFYMGNPGDESYIFRNVGRRGKPKFVERDILVDGDLVWGAAAADYDNDGDYDLFLSCGANEGICFDYLFKNRLVEDGVMHFVDVTAEAGIAGPIPPGGTEPIVTSSANGVWGDYNLDGYVDLFVSVNIWTDWIMDEEEMPSRFAIPPSALEEEDILGRNIMWRNNGDGTFTDVTEELGLDATLLKTRISTLLDIDNDGDLDLYENNRKQPQVLWRNRLKEDGVAWFEDATQEFSPPGEDLAYPHGSFASCAADFNNDGWLDIFTFSRGSFDKTSVYGEGHALFINQQGTGFVNVAQQAAINAPYEVHNGVMGSMIGDLNGDGAPDVFMGNGGPPGGQYNQLFLQDRPGADTPHFENQTALIDFEAPQDADARIDYPAYPYRTHGTAFVDIDGDGTLELVVSNGGPGEMDETVREPNRAFKFTWGDTPINYLRVRPVGDGVAVSRDGIGTRLALQVRDPSGERRTLYRTLFGGHCFSAQDGFYIHFLLGEAERVEELRLTWTDGTESVITEGLSVNTSFDVSHTGTGQAARVAVVDDSIWDRGDVNELATSTASDTSTQPDAYALSSVYPNPFNPQARFSMELAQPQHVTITVVDALGRTVTQLHDGVLPGQAVHQFSFRDAGYPSGVYLIRVIADTFTAARPAILMK